MSSENKGTLYSWNVLRYKMDIKLRPYQEKAVRKSIEHLKTYRSTLIVMPTGTGKTIVFVHIAGVAKGKVLMLAHRDELVGQAQRSVKKILGINTGIEKAEKHSSNEKIIIGSVQTLRGKRLEKFNPNTFSLIIVDEAHRAVAKSYKNIIAHFTGAKVIGVTATPDRTDKKSLGDVFESVAFEYGTIDAISDGWLVEPIAKRVKIKDINLSDVKTSGGDLNQEQLECKIGNTKSLHAIAKPLIELSGDRKTIIYTPGVQSAHELSEVLNGEKQGCSRAIDGTTPIEERRAILSDFNNGKIQHIVNCQILTEGFDSPGVSCIAIARPTKSRLLYAQMLGRGLRLFEGKNNCLVIDYIDVTERHDLCSPEDALGGDLGENIIEQAKQDREEIDQEKEPVNVIGGLLKAKSKVKYKTRTESLVTAQKRRAKEGNGRKVVHIEEAWQLFGFDPEEIEISIRWGLKPANESQVIKLIKSGIDPGEITYDIAKRIINVMSERKVARLASPAQLRLLSRYTTINPNITSEHASALINEIASRGWRKF
jgi:superfamily II DNA or RNA helicase